MGRTYAQADFDGTHCRRHSCDPRGHHDGRPRGASFTDQGHAIHQGNIDEESNGCVRLSQEPAQTFYSQLDPGETVQIVA